MSETNVPDVKIVLDKSKRFSECRGERVPEDPHYRVAYWQGQVFRGVIVLLPFDTQGQLVAEDAVNSPPSGAWQGLDNEGKPVRYHPLWTKPMRDLLDAKLKRQAAIAEAPEAEDELDVTDTDAASDEVNLVALLKGEAKYEWGLIQAAIKKRFHLIVQSKQQMVEVLCLDEKIVQEHELAPALFKLLPAKAA